MNWPWELWFLFFALIPNFSGEIFLFVEDTALKKQKRKARKNNNRDKADATISIVAPAGPIGERAAGKRLWLPLSLIILSLSCGLLFFNLGHYYLWYDEADTALFARGIARTGDMSAVIDHNIYAFHNGACLKNLRGRYQPPVPYYLAAPFVGRDGTGCFWPRFPFAVCGLLSVGLLLYWMIRSEISASHWIALSIGLLGNVSFFLFCRQCRYFSLTILLSLVVAYLYLNWKGRWWEYTGIILASILLLGTNYLSYAALYAVLGCDYILFTRRQLRLKFSQWLLLLGPQILVGIVTLWIFNPTGDEVAPDLPGRSFLQDKVLLLWWNLRDLNASEFCVGAIMLAALPVYIWKRNIWLLRGIIAGVCYIFTVVIFSPQHVSKTDLANVRYLVPVIPLFICLSALVIVLLARHKWPITLLLAVIFFASNVLNCPFSPEQWTCRPAEFVEELFVPQVTSVEVVTDWIENNVHYGDSIWVMPDFFQYSLLYHTPQAVYAWQLNDPPQQQFAALPPIHFCARIPVDYFIVFGDYKEKVDKVIPSLKNRGWDYRLIKVLDVYWFDKTRPEIMLRTFRTIKDFDRQFEAVYVYRRVKPQQLK